MSVDLITGDFNGGYQGHGSVAQRFLDSGGNLASFRLCDDAGGVLRRDEWEAYDKAVITTARENMNLLPEIASSSGVYDIGANPMGVMSLVWDKVSDYKGAQVDMTGEADDEFDRITYEQEKMCIPIVHNGFRLHLRTQLAAANNGGIMELTHAESATREVVRTLEDMAINSTYSAGPELGSVYGMMTYPHRTAFTLTGDWRTLSGLQIFNDVNAMLQAQVDNLQFSTENILYLPNIYMSKLNEEFAVGTDVRMSIREKLLTLPMLKDIRFNFNIKGQNVGLCPLKKEVVDLVNGVHPTMIHWEDKGGMVNLFKIIAILPVRWKSDVNGVSGLVHGSV